MATSSRTTTKWQSIMLPIKIKLAPGAVVPFKGTEHAAGYDLTALELPTYNSEAGYLEYRTGISLEIPPGYYGVLVPRSSISKYHLIFCNAPAIIDSDYRGELLVRFRKGVEHYDNVYQPGDKICQLIIRQNIPVDFIPVEQLTATTRGEGGFGSTGE